MHSYALMLSMPSLFTNLYTPASPNNPLTLMSLTLQFVRLSLAGRHRAMNHTDVAVGTRHAQLCFDYLSARTIAVPLWWKMDPCPSHGERSAEGDLIR